LQANDTQQMQPLKQRITSDRLAVFDEWFSSGSYILWFPWDWQQSPETRVPGVGQALGLQTSAQPEHMGFRHKPSQAVFRSEHGRGPCSSIWTTPRTLPCFRSSWSVWWLFMIGKGWNFGDSWCRKFGQP